MREFYIFGSVCRGEPDKGSDVDVLVIADGAQDLKNLPTAWSRYSRRRISVLYRRGTLFAWHLYLESVQLWPRDTVGFLRKIGPPRPYDSAVREISDLRRILRGAVEELSSGTDASVYEFGLLAMACRDIAMAAFPSLVGRFDFSRHAPLHLPTGFPLSKPQLDYLLQCRRASTRGGVLRRHVNLERQILTRLPELNTWCDKLLTRLKT
ncbi:MAG TPA: nucleotidyltransferase domain-containing protein [Lacunisphaera sp.]|jgi:hypothetical protein